MGETTSDTAAWSGASLLHGATILDPAPLDPTIDAVAVLDGRILAVGTTAVCRDVLEATTGGAFTTVDLGGRTLVPGFVDAHTHPLVMSVYDSHVNVRDARSIADVLDAVADRARTTDADETILGFELDDQVLAEKRLPTADELDAAAGGRRVVLIRRDGHHAVGSAAALAAAGLDEPGAVPEGGHVERDANGRLTGLVGEKAVSPLLGLMGDVRVEDLVAGAERWTRRLLSRGVTGLSGICQTSDEGPSGPAGALEAFGWSVIAPTLPFDIQTILIAPELAHVNEWRGVRELHEPAARRRLDAVKLFLDGTFGGATACMHAPFADRSHTSGMRTLDDDEAYRRMVEAHTAGLQICVHAIGDRANLDAARLFDRLLREHPGPHRHRVEHASILDAETIELFAKHDITCVVQPISIRAERHWLEARLGPDRIGRTYPYRSLLDAGVGVAGSSDAPIEDTDVIAAMHDAIDRRGIAPAEAISPLAALAMYTTGSARARRVETETGRIAAGMTADFAVLSASTAPASNAAGPNGSTANGSTATGSTANGSVRTHAIDVVATDPGAVTVDATVIGGTAHFVSGAFANELNSRGSLR